MPPLGICKLYIDQADQLLSLQKTKSRQTINNYKRSFLESPAYSLLISNSNFATYIYYLANTLKEKRKGIVINKMLYLSSKVKMKDPK